MNYEPCDTCAHLREAKNWDQAILCSRCKGKGLIPSPDASICNGCGRSLASGDGPNRQYLDGLVQQRLQGGYESDGLLDLHTYTFSLCETCLRKMIFRQCKIPPKITDWFGSKPKPVTWENDEWSFKQKQWSNGYTNLSNRRLHGLCSRYHDCKEPAAWISVDSNTDVLSVDTACEKHKEDLQRIHGRFIIPFLPAHQDGNYQRKPKNPSPPFVLERWMIQDRTYEIIELLRQGHDSVPVVLSQNNKDEIQLEVESFEARVRRYDPETHAWTFVDDYPSLYNPGVHLAFFCSYLEQLFRDAATKYGSVEIRTREGWTEKWT